jgi:NTE family protein
MKYVAIGPAAMGIFAYLGFFKRIERHLGDVEEFSGASAGAIIAALLCLGKGVDEIFDEAIRLDIDDFMQVNISSFLNNYGFVEMAPVRAKLRKFVDAIRRSRRLRRRCTSQPFVSIPGRRNISTR